MSRTTLNIEKGVLEEIRRIQSKERRSMGRIVSELLADALSHRRKSRVEPGLKWISRPMQPLVDLDDKDALYGMLDRGRK